MSLNAHLVELQRRHLALEKELEKEKLHPSASELHLAELKRKKLVLKDEIVKLRSATPAATMH